MNDITPSRSSRLNASVNRITRSASFSRSILVSSSRPAAMSHHRLPCLSTAGDDTASLPLPPALDDRRRTLRPPPLPHPRVPCLSPAGGDPAPLPLPPALDAGRRPFRPPTPRRPTHRWH